MAAELLLIIQKESDCPLICSLTCSLNSEAFFYACLHCHILECFMFLVKKKKKQKRLNREGPSDEQKVADLIDADDKELTSVLGATESERKLPT